MGLVGGRRGGVWSPGVAVTKAVTRESSGGRLFTFNGLGISVTTVVAQKTANHNGVVQNH